MSWWLDWPLCVRNRQRGNYAHFVLTLGKHIFHCFTFFRKGLGCCLGKCCDSTAATPGNHRFHNCHENQHHDFNEYQWISLTLLRFHLLLHLWYCRWNTSQDHHQISSSSYLLPAGVHPQHPFFAEADTARVQIEPLSQVLFNCVQGW